MSESVGVMHESVNFCFIGPMNVIFLRRGSNKTTKVFIAAVK